MRAQMCETSVAQSGKHESRLYKLSLTSVMCVCSVFNLSAVCTVLYDKSNPSVKERAKVQCNLLSLSLSFPPTPLFSFLFDERTH